MGFLLVSTGASEPVDAPSAPELIGCRGGWGPTLALLTPQPEGPLTLSSLHCVPDQNRGYQLALSPDGTKAWSYHARNGLWIGGVDQASPGHVFNERVPLRINMTAPFRWLPDSTAALGITNDIGGKANC